MPVFELQVVIDPPLTPGETVVVTPSPLHLIPGGSKRVSVQIRDTSGNLRNAASITNTFMTGPAGLNVWSRTSPKSPQSVPAAHELEIEAGGSMVAGLTVTVKGQAA